MKCAYPDCGRDEKRNGRCIFHLPEKNDVEAEEFLDQLLAEKRRAEDDPAEFAINFRGFIFPYMIFDHGYLGYFAPREFKKDVIFDRAVFETYTPFDGATFNGQALFEEATFTGYTSFAKAIFNGKASFDGATFNGNVLFHETTFNGDTSFDRTVFNRDAWFYGATFSSVTFRRTIFLGEVLMGAQFGGLTVFDRTVFQRDTIEPDDFAYLIEPKPLPNTKVTIFDGAIVDRDGEVRFIQPKEYNSQLGVEKNFCLSHVSFLNVDLEMFNFQDVEWGIYHGRKTIIEEVLMGRPPFEDVSPERVRQIYARLRRNQERALRYAEAGDFFVGEMEMRRRVLRSRGWRGLPEGIMLWIFKSLSNYGESVARPTLATLLVVLGFAGLRLLLNEMSDLLPNQPLSWQESVWRSVAAFFQLRSSSLWTDISERLISIPVLATLFIALKRKLERRS